MRSLLVITFLFLFSDISNAGWVINEESTDSYGISSFQTTFIQENVIRYESPSTISIVDLNTKLITIIFSEYQAYWIGTIDELRKYTLDAYDFKLQNLLAGLPENQRREFDSSYVKLKKRLIYSDKDTNNLILIKSNKTSNILGYRCVKYKVIEDSVTIVNIWHSDSVAPFSNIDVSEMVLFSKQLNSIVGKASLFQSEQYIKLLKNGIFLKHIDILPNNNKTETVVTKISKANIDSSFFKAPPNYRKVSMLDMT